MWRICFSAPVLGLVFCAFCFFSRAQTVLNVTNFGARSDVMRLYVNTVSNSTLVTVKGTNIFSQADVGKIIEIFRAGPWVTYRNWGPVVTQQDIISPIIKVSDGTNLTMKVPCGWTTNAFCIIGTNNAPAFQAAIGAATRLVGRHKIKNVTLDIPPGTYLMVSPYVLDLKYVMANFFDTHPALTISSGGITFRGESATNTILMGCGAGMNHLIYPGKPLDWISPGYAPCIPMRDTMILCQGPVAHNDYPLVFENLTFDGGVTNGAQSYNYWTPIQGNGEGWDTTHHAIADGDSLVSQQMNQLKVFTNCVFQHWRGEMLIGWTGDIPGACIDIANCTFYDGNATADNMYYGQHVHGCTFNQIEKVVEYYQYNANVPTIFEDNLMTNIAGDMIVINGARTNAIPPTYTIRNNRFYGRPNKADILFTPAENVVISNNQFYGQALGISFSAAGLQPADGSAAVMCNIVIQANNFHDTFLPIYADGYPVQNVTVADNTSSQSQKFAFTGGGWKMNWFFSDNNSRAILDSSAVQAGSYFVDEPGDNLGWCEDDDSIGGTNWINYAYSRRHLIVHVMTNSVFQVLANKLIPSGAVLEVSNASGQTIPLLAGIKLPPGREANFCWTNSAWQAAK